MARSQELLYGLDQQRYKGLELDVTLGYRVSNDHRECRVDRGRLIAGASSLVWFATCCGSD